MIEGAAGQLELALQMADNSPHNVVLIMCHPHPLEQGSMDHKVVTTTCRAFLDLDISSIRFNFRGVGNSAGSYGNAMGEREDLQAVMEWVRMNMPGKRMWLGGFSFGSAVASLCSHEEGVDQLLLIAPPVDRLYFESGFIPRVPCLVLIGDADEIVDPAAIFRWALQVKSDCTLIKFHGVGHFFHGQLSQLRQTLVQHYRGIL
jgi:alpha/beta superfamily hydrolase